VFMTACSALAVCAAPVAAAVTAVPQGCPHRTGRVVCVDQNHQLLWVQQGPKTVFPAVRVRTGRAGYRTPDGTYRIYLRNKTQWSYLFNEPMPYSQFFFRSYALHGTYQDVRKGGSNGCVNLTPDNAKRLWNVLGKGDLLYIWGHKSGA
jgi:lipoprotein-anchoring transpeptidase ErfK/SrfK